MSLCFLHVWFVSFETHLISFFFVCVSGESHERLSVVKIPFHTVTLWVHYSEGFFFLRFFILLFFYCQFVYANCTLMSFVYKLFFFFVFLFSPYLPVSQSLYLFECVFTDLTCKEAIQSSVPSPLGLCSRVKHRL